MVQTSVDTECIISLYMYLALIRCPKNWQIFAGSAVFIPASAKEPSLTPSPCQMQLATADRVLSIALAQEQAAKLKAAIISTIKSMAGLDPAHVDRSEASAS